MTPNDRTEPGVCPACRGTKMMDGGGGSRIPCDLCDDTGVAVDYELGRSVGCPRGCPRAPQPAAEGE